VSDNTLGTPLTLARTTASGQFHTRWDNCCVIEFSDDFIPANAPEAEHLIRVYKWSVRIRGAFMDQTIWLDTIITGILVLYFTEDAKKQSVLGEALTGRDFSFSARIELLEKVVKLAFPAFANTQHDFFTKLDKIRRFRNRLAHAQLETSDKFLAKGEQIQLVFYENGEEKHQTITLADVKLRLAECSQVLLQLVELQKLIKQVH
jgi:hypothetical protein